MTDNGNVFSFTWNIENFSMLPYQVGERLESSRFASDFWEKTNFCLWLFPKGEDGSEESIACYLCKCPAEPSLKLTFSLTLESTDLASVITHLQLEKELGSGRGITNFVSLSTLFTKKHLYLPHDTLTVRCDLKPIVESPAKSLVSDELNRSFINFMGNSCISRTSIPIHRRSVIWPVQNIKRCLEQQINANQIIRSPLKKSPVLIVSLIFDAMSSNGCIQIEIKQVSLCSETEIFVNCKMTVISPRKEFQEFEESSHRFSLNLNDAWKFPAFIKASNLTQDKYLFLDDTMLLQCDFAFTHDNSEYDTENNYMPFPFRVKSGDKTSELCTGIENLYTDEKFCDIQLQTCDRTFPFYKIVLCARSPVFSAMLENDMKEKISSIIEITDVDPDTLNRLLTFMCTDTIKEDLSPEEVCKLYRAADKYDVVSLKNLCSGLLASSVSMDSMCDVLVIADTHQDNVLMTAVLNFIRHHIKETFHSSHWAVVMNENPKLAMETMLKFL